MWIFRKPISRFIIKYTKGIKSSLKFTLLDIYNKNSNVKKTKNEYKKKVKELFKKLDNSLFEGLKNEKLDECLRGLITVFGNNKTVLVDLILNDYFDEYSLTGLIRMLPFVKSSDPNYSGFCNDFAQLLNTLREDNNSKKMGLRLIALLLAKIKLEKQKVRRDALAKFFNSLFDPSNEYSVGAVKGLISLLPVCKDLYRFASGLANLLYSFHRYGEDNAKFKFEPLLNLLNFVFESKNEIVKGKVALLITLLDGGQCEEGCSLMAPSVNFVNLITKNGVLKKFKEKLKDKDFGVGDFVDDLSVKVDVFDEEAFLQKWEIGESVQSDVNNNFIGS